MREDFEFHPPAPFGPIYPDLGVKVAKLRNERTLASRRAHGLAVLSAIQAKNRALLNRELAPASNLCYASRTAHTDGRVILRAVRMQHMALIVPDWSISKYLSDGWRSVQ